MMLTMKRLFFYERSVPYLRRTITKQVMFITSSVSACVYFHQSILDRASVAGGPIGVLSLRLKTFLDRYLNLQLMPLLSAVLRTIVEQQERHTYINPSMYSWTNRSISYPTALCCLPHDSQQARPYTNSNSNDIQSILLQRP